jgi:hypothetical protein
LETWSHTRNEISCRDFDIYGHPGRKILFGIRLTSLLIELAMSGLFRARWSLDIHREWMEAVHTQHGISMCELDYRRQCMETAIPDGLVDGYEPLVSCLTLPDPNDRHVHQLNVLRRKSPKRVALSSIDRLLLVGLYRLVLGCWTH